MMRGRRGGGGEEWVEKREGEEVKERNGWRREGEVEERNGR